ncbi:hypothetical protein Amet_2917 [Alkaliphilus metalliredigens QYMF]|uniref:Lipoprotein n=1 Tax=Alkaliphilus metalliredigens (strain QYMF) TaxID=293826 RepID=A6TS99_ALKMQ|nr:hypothetical protein [Alkaliphilus metalliredigens]ABR49067.1 hypothetical protein Amet_2917 [Alkaliphilus metalliredigens QYMF]
MKININLKLLIFLILVPLLIVGCAPEQVEQEEFLGVEEDLSIQEGLEDQVVVPYDLSTPEGLQQQLLEARAIEMRTIDNETVGMLQEMEEVTDFIERIFEITIRKEFDVEFDEGSVIGPINFYFDTHEDIFALLKENILYIEGYYFLVTPKEAAQIKQTFKNSGATGPITGE